MFPLVPTTSFRRRSYAVLTRVSTPSSVRPRSYALVRTPSFVHLVRTPRSYALVRTPRSYALVRTPSFVRPRSYPSFVPPVRTPSFVRPRSYALVRTPPFVRPRSYTPFVRPRSYTPVRTPSFVRPLVRHMYELERWALVVRRCPVGGHWIDNETEPRPRFCCSRPWRDRAADHARGGGTALSRATALSASVAFLTIGRGSSAVPSIDRSRPGFPPRSRRTPRKMFASRRTTPSLPLAQASRGHATTKSGSRCVAPIRASGGSDSRGVAVPIRAEWRFRFARWRFRFVPFSASG